MELIKKVYLYMYFVFCHPCIAILHLKDFQRGQLILDGRDNRLQLQSQCWTELSGLHVGWMLKISKMETKALFFNFHMGMFLAAKEQKVVLKYVN